MQKKQGAGYELVELQRTWLFWGNGFGSFHWNKILYGDPLLKLCMIFIHTMILLWWREETVVSHENRFLTDLKCFSEPRRPMVIDKGWGMVGVQP